MFFNGFATCVYCNAVCLRNGLCATQSGREQLRSTNFSALLALVGENWPVYCDPFIREKEKYIKYRPGNWYDATSTISQQQPRQLFAAIRQRRRPLCHNCRLRRNYLCQS